MKALLARLRARLHALRSRNARVDTVMTKTERGWMWFRSVRNHHLYTAVAILIIYALVRYPALVELVGVQLFRPAVGAVFGYLVYVALFGTWTELQGEFRERAKDRVVRIVSFSILAISLLP